MNDRECQRSFSAQVDENGRKLRSERENGLKRIRHAVGNRAVVFVCLGCVFSFCSFRMRSQGSVLRIEVITPLDETDAFVYSVYKGV